MTKRITIAIAPIKDNRVGTRVLITLIPLCFQTSKLMFYLIVQVDYAEYFNIYVDLHTVSYIKSCMIPRLRHCSDMLHRMLFR